MGSLNRAQMVEKDKAQAEFRVKANSDKTELAGILHQIKTKMTEKGLVSAEELEQYKDKTFILQGELDKLKKEMVKKSGEESPTKGGLSRVSTKLFNVSAAYKKDQAVQCVAEKRAGSPERTTREIKNVRATKGMAASFEDFSSGYIEPMVRSNNTEFG